LPGGGGASAGGPGGGAPRLEGLAAPRWRLVGGCAAALLQSGREERRRGGLGWSRKITRGIGFRRR
jgi:hypothetical protein